MMRAAWLVLLAACGGSPAPTGDVTLAAPLGPYTIVVADSDGTIVSESAALDPATTPVATATITEGDLVGTRDLASNTVVAWAHAAIGDHLPSSAGDTTSHALAVSLPPLDDESTGRYELDLACAGGGLATSRYAAPNQPTSIRCGAAATTVSALLRHLHEPIDDPTEVPDSFALLLDVPFAATGPTPLALPAFQPMPEQELYVTGLDGGTSTWIADAAGDLMPFDVTDFSHAPCVPPGPAAFLASASVDAGAGLYEDVTLGRHLDALPMDITVDESDVPPIITAAHADGSSVVHLDLPDGARGSYAVLRFDNWTVIMPIDDESVHVPAETQLPPGTLLDELGVFDIPALPTYDAVKAAPVLFGQLQPPTTDFTYTQASR
ncbi:MAG TPA: hypothetical protein VGM88_24510 [Kofleriaceae bacterium]|jgi:hypothetical protein